MDAEILPDQSIFRGLMPQGWVAVRKSCVECQRLFNTGRSPEGKSQDKCAYCFDGQCSSGREET